MCLVELHVQPQPLQHGLFGRLLAVVRGIGGAQSGDRAAGVRDLLAQPVGRVITPFMIMASDAEIGGNLGISRPASADKAIGDHVNGASRRTWLELDGASGRVWLGLDGGSRPAWYGLGGSGGSVLWLGQRRPPPSKPPSMSSTEPPGVFAPAVMPPPMPPRMDPSRSPTPALGCGSLPVGVPPRIRDDKYESTIGASSGNSLLIKSPLPPRLPPKV